MRVKTSGTNTQYQPHAYQTSGIKYLKENKFALLADEMGLGKTFQTIKAIDELELSNILVVCPSFLKINWKREFEKFSDFDRDITIVENKKTVIPMSGILIVSYTSAHLVLSTSRCFDVVILDESHFLKNPGSKRTQAVYGKAGLIRKTKRCWGLSGTPCPNGNPSELWTMIYTYGHTNLGYDDFIKRYCCYYMFNRRIVPQGFRPEKKDELHDTLNQFMLRRVKEGNIKLPPVVSEIIYVKPEFPDIDIHKDFSEWTTPIDKKKALLTEIKKQEAVIKDILWETGSDNIFGAVQAMSESMATLRKYIGLSKVHAAEQYIKKFLAEHPKEKLVVFCYHTSVIDELMERLEKYNPLELRGSQTPKKKQRTVDQFHGLIPGDTQFDYRVLIGQIRACGVGMNLTCAAQGLFVELDWTPAWNTQAQARLHRIGQKKTVFIDFLAAADTHDELLNDKLAEKIRSMNEIMRI